MTFCDFWLSGNSECRYEMSPLTDKNKNVALGRSVYMKKGFQEEHANDGNLTTFAHHEMIDNPWMVIDFIRSEVGKLQHDKPFYASARPCTYFDEKSRNDFVTKKVVNQTLRLTKANLEKYEVGLLKKFLTDPVYTYNQDDFERINLLVIINDLLTITLANKLLGIFNLAI
ncbi:hypothetical protein HELRODRAFT_164605 [Helobdella robusta]|uniref:Uncharacterized protein n=1 Tax=Helobdella robusta TaxID=6412 RepID=T1EVM6_HELRO|nr:hypothetical protein HELRODRAFT_164605 [Helobdella robusta]ESN94718.1 hypothetical protein HELRODRAFT_164605 [Helobdella robusta]